MKALVYPGPKKVSVDVVLPFNVGGFCANCERGLSGYCLACADPSVMPGMAGAAYGFAGMGPYSGGQAEYLRVPYADFKASEARVPWGASCLGPCLGEHRHRPMRRHRSCSRCARMRCGKYHNTLNRPGARLAVS